MKQLLIIFFAGIVGFSASAQDSEPVGEPVAETLDIFVSTDVVLADFVWLNRVIVVFANTDRDPAFQKQMELLNERPSDLIERDVIVITDTNPAEPSDIRLELRPRGFGLVLIDKDGAVKLRKPSPWSARELAHSIDKTPSRIDELKDR